MNALFPGPKRFTIKNDKGDAANFRKTNLDWTAKVVCKPCNITWMSNIENNHAKPTMTPLIIGNVDVPIDHLRAESIARFAFKTAIVLDHMRRGQQPFFPRRVRHDFRTDYAIPAKTVNMWLAGFGPRADGHILSTYHEGGLSPEDRLKLYVCTYAVGYLVFQVVARKQYAISRVDSFRPSDARFEGLAKRFWPWLPARGVVWPFAGILETLRDFEDFANRWENLVIDTGF